MQHLFDCYWGSLFCFFMEQPRVFWLSDKNLSKSEAADPVFRISCYFVDTQELREKAGKNRWLKHCLARTFRDLLFLVISRFCLFFFLTFNKIKACLQKVWNFVL